MASSNTAIIKYSEDYRVDHFNSLSLGLNEGIT